MRRSIACVALLLSLAGASSVALAGKHPDPSLYPIAWELKFRHAAPKRIVVNVPGVGPSAYWYVTYTVTNNSDAEQQFLPNFEMVTTGGKIIPSDRAIPLKVFETIKSAEGNPLLESAKKIAGIIHVGDDQARDGVAIWPEPQTRMSDFTIYVSGLSGEYVNLKDDDGKQISDANGKPVILRKTLELNEVVWGDELYPDKDEVHEKPDRWVMR